jgi:hypothetical protein
MSRKIMLVTPVTVTNDLPVLSAGSVLKKPDAPMFNEPLDHNYTGEELLAIMKKHNVELVGGVKILPGVLNSLSPDYVFELYMNTRYGLPTSPSVMPVRAMQAYSTSYLALKAYPVVSLLFSSLYQENIATINPLTKYESENMVRILRHVNYSWLEAAKRFELAPQDAAKVIVSKALESQRLGTLVETHDIYYLNADNANPLLVNGVTVNDLVDYYESTGLQPTA